MCIDVLTMLFDSGALEGSSFLGCLLGAALHTCPAYAVWSLTLLRSTVTVTVYRQSKTPLEKLPGVAVLEFQSSHACSPASSTGTWPCFVLMILTLGTPD